jgi:hypothetical protein
MRGAHACIRDIGSRIAAEHADDRLVTRKPVGERQVPRTINGVGSFAIVRKPSVTPVVDS